MPKTPHRLVFVNSDMNSKKEKEWIKNMSEGLNQNIFFFPPDKQNLVKFKKTFIRKLIKDTNICVKEMIARLILHYIERTDDEYWYFDCHCKESTNNNYYECYCFSEKNLTDQSAEDLIPNLPRLFEIKKKQTK